MNKAHATVLHMHEEITKNIPHLANVTIYNLVTQHGRDYQGRRKPRDFRFGPQKQCFLNTYTLVEEEYVSEYLDGPPEDEWVGLTYVEGFVVTEIGMPIHHAWAVTDDEQVVDITLRYDSRSSRLKRDPTTWSYFGIPLRFPFVQRVTSERGYYGVLDMLKDLPTSEILTKSRWSRSAV